MSIAVLFDVDGTLSDSGRLGISSTDAVLGARGIAPVSEAAYHEGTRLTTPRRLAWHATGDPSDPLGFELGAEFDKLYVALVSQATTPLYPGIAALLSALATEHPNCLFGAVSNACDAYAKAVLRVNGLSEVVPVALGADAVAAAKPAPDGLLECAQRLGGVPPARCVYVGDSPTDGQAAAAAGMQSVGVTWGSHSEAVLAPHFTAIVHTPAQLLDALRGLLVLAGDR